MVTDLVPYGLPLVHWVRDHHGGPRGGDLRARELVRDSGAPDPLGAARGLAPYCLGCSDACLRTSPWYHVPQSRMAMMMGRMVSAVCESEYSTRTGTSG